jgi:hypothetical protein
MEYFQILDYKIQAESISDACKTLSKLGLLKGHRLQSMDGTWKEIEYLNFDGGYFCEKTPSIEGRLVFSVSENYHSPECYKILRSNDGTYISVFSNRRGKIFRNYGLTLAEAFAKAKNICRSFNKQFGGFFPIEKDWMKDSIYKGMYFGKLYLVI